MLFVALVGFISPPYLAADLLLRRVQLDLVDAVVGHLAYDVLREYDSSCIRRDLHSSIFRARHELKRARADQSLARAVAKSAQRRDSLERYIDEQLR